MPSRIEEVVAHDGVIIRIVIDPADRISGVDSHREGCKPILLRNNHLLLHRMVVGTDAASAQRQGNGYHRDYRDTFRELMHRRPSFPWPPPCNLPTIHGAD